MISITSPYRAVSLVQLVILHVFPVNDCTAETMKTPALHLTALYDTPSLFHPCTTQHTLPTLTTSTHSDLVLSQGLSQGLFEPFGMFFEAFVKLVFLCNPLF